MLDEKDDANGDLGYRLGAAFLVPYPNRIRGKLSADGKTLTTEWEGHTITLPANNIGKNPGAERHAMHGLILKAKTDDVHVKDIPGGQSHRRHPCRRLWRPLALEDRPRLHHHAHRRAVDASIVAHNVGSEAEPIAIGWHPYFNLPSGDRTQVRIHIPGTKLPQVDNYDNVFPTGKLMPVDGTQYDLRAPGGVPLGQQLLRRQLEQARLEERRRHRQGDRSGRATTAWRSKASRRRSRPSRCTRRLPMQFVAIEDQFNFADPFGKEWGTMDTGMVTLKPGQSTKWHVRLHVFVP